MSGLETAIRNALEKSDRTSPEIRARIYQSARQALDAGLQKQGISDQQVVAAQRQRLELKIREIEMEERARMQPVSAPAAPQAAPPAPKPATPPDTSVRDASILGGATRDEASPAAMAPGETVSSLDALRAERAAPAGPAVSEEPKGRAMRSRGRGRKRDAAILDAPPERAAKPRRRRGFLSVLVAWLVFFALMGLAAWWAYSSGLVQQSLQQAMEATERSLSGQGAGSVGPSPQTGFSEEWVEVFDGADAAAVEGGASTAVEPASTSVAPALRLTSGSPAGEGDVAVTIPAEVLHELAGKSSTIALTVRSATEAPVQFSVRCDFGSLGTCPRHRFTARQEREDLLLRVTFDRSIAPNVPGKLLLNTALDGAQAALLLHSVRVLPGQ
nr:regulator [Rhizobium sp. Q54]